MNGSRVMTEAHDRHFVGRAAEIDVTMALCEAPRHHAAFVVIDGESGIGKTRLLAELATRGRAMHVSVLAGCATEVGSPLPFGLLMETLADARGSVVAALFAGGTPPGLERHRLYRTVRTLLESAGPVLILIDDLQWADEASVELLDYLVRHPPRGRIVVVLAHRTGPWPVRLSQSLTQLREHVTRLPLGPLSLADFDELLPDLSPARRRRLYEASCGNPLYLEILASADDHRAVLELGRAPAVIDDRVEVALDEMIRSDLRGLPAPQRLVAAAAAVAGEDFDPALIGRAAGLSTSRTIAAIDALVVRDVLRHAGGSLVFRHPLVRAAAYGLAGPAWRFAAHVRAAEYLAETGASAVRQAQHLEYASGRVDDRTATVLAAAAADVLETAPSGSVRWLYAALAALPERPDTWARRGRMRLMLARALAGCGRFGESKELLSTLLGSAGGASADGTSADEQSCAALALLAATERSLGRLAQARELLLGALAGAVDEATIRLELAITDVLDGRFAEAEAHAIVVLRRCRGGGRLILSAAAEIVLALVTALGGVRVDAGEKLDRARRTVDALDGAALRGMLELIAPLAWVELMAEHHDDALRHLERGIAAARGCGRPHVTAGLMAMRSVAYGRLGRVTDALREADDVAEASLIDGDSELLRFASATRLRPSLWRDGVLPARALLDQVLAAPPLRSPWWRAVAGAMTAEAALDLGDPQMCLGLLADRGAGGSRLRARAELMRGDPAAGRLLYDRTVRGPRSEPSEVALLEVELLVAEHRHDDAIDAGQAAAAHASRAGLPVCEGRIRVLLGDLHHRAGDVASARTQFGLARHLFTCSGADWLAAQANSALRRLSVGRPRTQARAVGAPVLSDREREVASMVAEGLTNRAIAERLFLSPRTVEAHLTRIFAKLGVSTRATLVRLLGTVGETSR